MFAAQAKVPVRREDREQILLALAETGSAVVKLRALSTEWQTHHEPWPYPQLYAALVQAGRVAPDALHFAAGSMTEALAERPRAGHGVVHRRAGGDGRWACRC